MADIFIEHIVEQKKSAASRLIGVGYIFALVLVIVATLLIDYSLTLLAVVGGIWLVVKLINNLNMEFEYIVTNGELDIDRITGRSKRKRILSVDSRIFEILAPDNAENFSAYERMVFKQKIDASSRENSRYFAVCPSKAGGKLLLYFDPSERMLEAFKTYNPRAIRQ